MEEEKRAEDVGPIESHVAEDSQKNNDADIKIKRRENSEGPTEIEPSQADRAALLMLLQQQVGN